MSSLSREQVRAIDRIAIDQLGIPGVVLMENAGINATACILDVLDRECGVSPAEARAAVLCGGGNNGGDGYVIARHLHNRGLAVTVDAVKNPAELTGDAAINHAICANMGLDIRTDIDPSAWCKAHVLVDALLGTGFTGEVRGDLATVIEQINATDGPHVVAIDLPSGLDCDTGEPTNATIRADLTVTFVAPKRGFDNPASEPHTGRVAVADIGVPPDLVKLVSDDEAGSPRRGLRL